MVRMFLSMDSSRDLVSLGSVDRVLQDVDALMRRTITGKCQAACLPALQDISTAFLLDSFYSRRAGACTRGIEFNPTMTAEPIHRNCSRSRSPLQLLLFTDLAAKDDIVQFEKGQIIALP